MDEVIIICYREAKTMRRQEAIEFFAEGVAECDGSEKERYANILADLLAGKHICRDC